MVEQLETAGNAGDGLWRVYLPPIRAGNHHAAVCQTQMEMTAFRPPTSWAFEPNVFTFTYDPAQSKKLLDEAGYPDPDGDGPLPRLSLSLKTSTAEFNRLLLDFVNTLP